MFSFINRLSMSMNVADKMGDDNDSVNMTNWMKDIQSVQVHRSEMNQLVMNYLVTEGFKDAAEKFRTEAGVEPKQSLDTLDDRIKVRAAVQNGDVDEAITLTNTLNPEILDGKDHLFFHLQQLKLIELIRNKDIEQALEFAQEVMSELSTENPGYLSELEQTMGLLAYDDPASSPFGNLLDLAHRHMVASEVNAAILESEHQEAMPKLAGVLKLLMWTQGELDKKRIKYPKMTDVASGRVKYINDDTPATTPDVPKTSSTTITIT